MTRLEINRSAQRGIVTLGFLTSRSSWILMPRVLNLFLLAPGRLNPAFLRKIRRRFFSANSERTTECPPTLEAHPPGSLTGSEDRSTAERSPSPLRSTDLASNLSSLEGPFVSLTASTGAME